MNERLLAAFIMLIAGAITCIIDIYRRAEVLPSLTRLLAVLIIFYIIGLVAGRIIKKTMKSRPKDNNNNAGNVDNEKTEKDNGEDHKKETGMNVNPGKGKRKTEGIGKKTSPVNKK